MFIFKKKSTEAPQPQISVGTKARSLTITETIIPNGTASNGYGIEDFAEKMLSLGKEYDAFTERFSSDLVKVGRHFIKLSSDNQSLTARNERLFRECAQAKDALVSAGAKIESTAGDCARLTAEVALLSGKLHRALDDHRADREQLAALRMRNETLDADYSKALVERDKYQNEIVSARHELNDLTQKNDHLRIKVDQYSTKEVNADNRIRLLEVETENYRIEVERYKITSGEITQKASVYNNDYLAAQERINQLEIERDSITAVRDRLSAQCVGYSVKIEEMRRQFDASLDGLSRTKAFLWDNSEKQRRQIADQAARIAQLERSNADLSNLLSETTLSRIGPAVHETDDEKDPTKVVFHTKFN